MAASVVNFKFSTPETQRVVLKIAIFLLTTTDPESKRVMEINLLVNVSDAYTAANLAMLYSHTILSIAYIIST